MYMCTLCIKNITGLMAADISANASNIRKINQITLRAVITRPHLDDLAGGDARRFIRLDALSAHFRNCSAVSPLERALSLACFSADASFFESVIARPVLLDGVSLLVLLVT